MTMRDERVDSAIDEVASGLTAGEPGRTFTARVLARIESGDAPHRTWRTAWVLSPLAAAAALVLALVLLRHGAGPDLRRPDPPGAEAGSTASAAGSDRVSTAATVRAGLAKAEGSGVEGLRARAVRSAPQSAPSELDALAPPALTVDPLEVPRIGPADSIELQKLDTIAPIDVTPLGSDYEGDRP